MSDTNNRVDIEEFLKLVKYDEDLQKLVAKVDVELEESEENSKIIEEKIIPAAKERGYSFTSEEFLSFLKEAGKAITPVQSGAISSAQESDESKDSTQGVEEAKSSGFGGGKIGKIALILGGGATVGVGGMMAYRHFNDSKKPEVAQVQSAQPTSGEANSNDASLDGGDSGDNIVKNDGLRPQASEEKTSDELKKTLNNHPSEAEGGKGGAPAPAAKSSEGKGPSAPAHNNAEQRKKLEEILKNAPPASPDEVRKVEEEMDALAENKDGIFDKQLADLEKMFGEKMPDEQKNAMRDLVKKQRDDFKKMSAEEKAKQVGVMKQMSSMHGK